MMDGMTLSLLLEGPSVNNRSQFIDT